MEQGVLIRRITRQLRHELSQDLSLQRLAARHRMSAFSLHRAFAQHAGEPPAAYVRRLRVMQAAALLQAGRPSLREVARRCGFLSVEVFTRNFVRAFGCAPGAFRRRWRMPPQRRISLSAARLLQDVSACQSMYHLPVFRPRRSAMPTLSIELRDIPAQPVVCTRSRVARSEIAATIGAELGRIVPHVLGNGGQLAGQPYTRYHDMNLGMLTIEVGMPVAAAVAGAGTIEAATLPAGQVAVALHGGAYEQLGDSYAALERWLTSQSLKPAGAPWEVYVNDPGEHPDPAAWRTEIYWPCARA